MDSLSPRIHKTLGTAIRCTPQDKDLGAFHQQLNDRVLSRWHGVKCSPQKDDKEKTQLRPKAWCQAWAGLEPIRTNFLILADPLVVSF